MYKYKVIRKKDGSKIDEHRFIWIQFNGEIPDGMIIHHKNGNGRDNRIENLEIMSLAEHSRMHTILRGNAHLRKSAEHGTTSSYRRGCRCSVCKERQRIKMQRYRAKIKLREVKEDLPATKSVL